MHVSHRTEEGSHNEINHLNKGPIPLLYYGVSLLTPPPRALTSQKNILSVLNKLTLTLREPCLGPFPCSQWSLPVSLYISLARYLFLVLPISPLSTLFCPSHPSLALAMHLVFLSTAFFLHHLPAIQSLLHAHKSLTLGRRGWGAGRSQLLTSNSSDKLSFSEATWPASLPGKGAVSNINRVPEGLEQEQRGDLNKRARLVDSQVRGQTMRSRYGPQNQAACC